MQIFQNTKIKSFSYSLRTLKYIQIHLHCYSKLQMVKTKRDRTKELFSDGKCSNNDNNNNNCRLHTKVHFRIDQFDKLV